MELMTSIRNPNSIFLLHRANFPPPLTLCSPPRSLRLHFSIQNSPRALVSFAASHKDSEQSSVVDDEDRSEEEAWKQTLESLKDQVTKVSNSQKGFTVLKDTSEQLRIQAEKAKEDLGTMAKESSSPSNVEEIVEAFASTDNLNDVSRANDFHVGIPYGLLLFVGGFISFMVTGSIPAIRFGVILGGALFALSLASLKSQKNGESSTKFLQGQTAIVTIIFLRELKLVLSRRSSFFGFLTTLTSGCVLAFYVYKMMMRMREKRPNLEDGGEEDEASGGFVRRKG